ncbi:hypothetical protein COJ27_16050 [Bacillus cereus]|uniref:abortive infection system toxin AbiGii family protein n=1 Tax=Bacillus cereus TaxID=1396 RepID=UPI000BF869A1|nr:abortive infection system toxin AbiGii family protein [Bacillus cereus]PFL63316.1 hypothetical protein COJ27_16050 [Bacillus cereus]
MFADFKKAFKRNESENKKIPKAILDAMSDNLPSGLKYIQDYKEYCKVIPENGEFEFKLNNFNFDDLNVKIEKGIQLKNIDELVEYLYRTQQELKGTTKKDFVIINGEKVKFSELVKSPFRDIDTNENNFELSITPESFGDPFPLKVKYDRDNIVKEFLIERQPLAQMHQSLFKSINSDALEIQYTVHEKYKTLKFNVHIDIKKAKTVFEIIEAYKMYKAFIDGTITIEGMELKAVPNDKERSAASAALEYWETVQKVAEKLDVQFKPNEGEESKNSEWIAKLCRSFIEKKPYKQRSGTAKFITLPQENWDGQEILGKEAMAFQFTQDEIIEVYGVEIPLYSAMAILNCRVESILPVNEKYEFNIVPANEKGIYQATQHFNTKGECIKIFKNPGDLLKQLSIAEEL